MPIDQHATARAPRGWLWALLGVIAAAYLLSPVLFSQHLEGYTANLQSIAITWGRGQLATQDVIMPVLTDYLFTTRTGIVLLLRSIDGLFGPAGDAGFRGLMIASFVLLAVSSVSIARRWGGVSALTCVAAFLLMPGLVAVGSFFNDNLVSASLAIAALAAVSRWNSLPACVAAGGLLGFAVMCRTDAALLSPVLAGIVWLQNGRLGPLVARGAAIGAGLLAVFALVFVLTGLTLVDVLRVTGSFFPPKVGIAFRVLVAALFLGVPGLILLCVGVVLNVRQHLLGSRDLRWSLAFLVCPALIGGIAVLRLSTEVRYIYPLLAPFCLMHIGRGLDWLMTMLKTPGWTRRIGATAVAALIVLLAVPPITFVRDGPQSAVGRLWMPLLWFRWQNSVAESLRQLDGIVTAAQKQSQVLVLSTHFNDDFFLKLRMLQSGFEVQPAEDAFKECRSGFSVYAKPGHRVVHLRTDNQYGLVPLKDEVVVRSVFIQRALQCAGAWQFDQAYLTFVGRDTRALNPPLDPELFDAVIPRLPPALSLSTSFAFSPSGILHPLRHVSPGPATSPELLVGDIHVSPLTTADLRQIEQAADRIIAERKPQGTKGSFVFEDILAVYRKRS